MRLDHLLSKEKALENKADLRSINKDLQVMLYNFECSILIE